MMKKFILILLLVFTSVSYAQINDYSTGNSNPITKYKYTTPNEQAIQANINNEQPVSYFTNQIQNPKTLSFNNNGTGKYKYLIQTADYTKGCWDNAGRVYNLDPWLLMAIAKVESSFKHNAINTNKNHSTDIGMMQINTIWLPTLRKFGIEKRDLLNPCTSIFVGAWIMAQNIKNFGYNLDGIGAYNSPGNVKIRRNYAQKVYKAYNELTYDLYYTKR
jgi:soluble lytic murein transglycosylase-like protein